MNSHQRRTRRRSTQRTYEYARSSFWSYVSREIKCPYVPADYAVGPEADINIDRPAYVPYMDLR